MSPPTRPYAWTPAFAGVTSGGGGHDGWALTLQRIQGALQDVGGGQLVDQLGAARP